ncbi:MAG: SDR family oxidoreductase [Anaerolineales bacterium]|nr:SDR family oxidoreductase [Anaerolineales bacterium]MCB0013812.1 SDR family oxidoreductase [Anaerolineales bacterium]MCB0030780.1 SDR family oxidoreductase [Anaerolineales bacterium]MCB8961937.1 SDR family oxidoreductase [Ardenticatenales bacterium]
MNGKVCMITGGSTGIGKETALGLARQGATIIIVNRDQARGEAALAEIKALSGNGNVELMLADLSDMAAVRDLADRVKAQYHRLDLLINNAGIVARQRELTVDGYEKTFAVNHLAPFLLTNRLLDLLKQTPGARVINLASQVHAQTIDFDNLQAEKGFHGLAPYRLSKLANIMFTYELARRLAGSDVTVNCLHPGVIATDLLSNFNQLWAQEQGQPEPAAAKRGGFLRRIRNAFRSEESGGETVADGARQVLHLATAPELAGVSGKYWRYGQFEQTNPISYDEALAARLWEVSAELTGISEVSPTGP